MSFGLWILTCQKGFNCLKKSLICPMALGDKVHFFFKKKKEGGGHGYG